VVQIDSGVFAKCCQGIQRIKRLLTVPEAALIFIDLVSPRGPKLSNTKVAPPILLDLRAKNQSQPLPDLDQEGRNLP
jgi:hypothetical protein